MDELRFAACVLQAPSTEQDGNILIKIDKASLKISLGKTHLVKHGDAKFFAGG